MGHIFSYKDAVAFEQFLSDSQNRDAIALQNRLMAGMLSPISGKAALGVGWGASTALKSLSDQGIQVSGLDPSPYMLDLMEHRLGNRADLRKGQPESLPFEDNSFHYICMIHALEFADDPALAIAEACRVGRERLFIWTTNRYSAMGIQHWIEGRGADSIYRPARFRSVWELLRIIRGLSGNVPLEWVTTSRGSKGATGSRSWLTTPKPVRWWPFGAYAAVSVTLTPRFRTQPLTVAYSAKP